LTETRLDVTTTRVALALGFRRADELSRLLVARHLPPFYRFRNWVYIVQLVEYHEGGTSLARWAWRQGIYPTVYYRLVRSESGMRWNELSVHGSTWAKAQALRAWAPHLAAAERGNV
jgi:hypothetical protein